MVLLTTPNPLHVKMIGNFEAKLITMEEKDHEAFSRREGQQWRTHHEGKDAEMEIRI